VRLAFATASRIPRGGSRRVPAGCRWWQSASCRRSPPTSGGRPRCRTG